MTGEECLNAAVMGANEIMSRFKAQELPPTERFHYHQCVFLQGIEQLYKITGEKRYFDYIKDYVDFNIDGDGFASHANMTEFDDLQPAVLLFNLYKETGDVRYKKWLDTVKCHIERWPTNALGGVWHKYRNKNQLWLDTMYMMGVLAAELAFFNSEDEYLINKVYTQMRLIKEHMINKENGLLYHMWDDSRKNKFADKEDGLVKVHWGRAMSWYVAAMFSIAELMPHSHPLRSEFTDTGVEFLKNVIKYRNNSSGLWYQVLDMTQDERNWEETSCSALFTYAAAKAYNLGVKDKECESVIESGFNGVMSKAQTKDDKLYLSGVCIGTGVGILDMYFDRPTVTNDLHGMGAFLLMCTEVYKYFQNKKIV